VLGHIVVGVALPVGVEDQIPTVQASGWHRGMNGVGVASTTQSVGVDKADGTP
jgi:hypothetical protein